MPSITLQTRIGKIMVDVAMPTIEQDQGNREGMKSNVAVTIVKPEEGDFDKNPRYHHPEEKIEFMCSKADLRAFMKNLDLLL